MKTLFRLFLPAVFLLAPLVARAQTVTDPRITSWLTTKSGAYARVWETTADKTSGNAVATWPRSGLTNRGGGQSVATYSDVARVVYSANYVYVYTTGLASYTMGPWLDPNGGLFGMWPTNRGAIHQIPRNPTIPATKTRTGGGGGVLVNGVFLWNNGDAQSYTTSTGQVSFQGQGIWNRLAGPTEGPTFDGGLAHQPQTGEYHNHVNPRALRYQLGDAVAYDATTKTYSEVAPTKHSPIIGWAGDGLPVYGPYGYSDPTSAMSGVRRMTSGFTKRDGTLGTVNLATTGRVTLPVWAAAWQGRSATLAANQYGPAVGTASPIGTFSEDYEYLGDLGKTQGTDFDLNRQNVRFCVTPEFPNGTYAYFTCIDASGNSVFPDIINQEYFGTPTQGRGTVNAITETVTEYVRGGQASPITVTAVAAGTSVLVSWTSVEGGTYSVSTSADGVTFTALSAGLASAGTTTTLTTTTVASYYRVTLTAVATYDAKGNGGIDGTGTTGTKQYTASAGDTGTARLVNIATRAQIGGSAGTPIAGFVISGTGSKKMLVRAVGPTLTTYGVTGALADPSLSLVSGSATVASNDNWLATDAATASAVGAFALNAASKDAALAATLVPGAYSSPVGAGGGSGVALLEVYDADTSTSPTATLVNASTRAFVGTGEQVLIPGFVISGAGTVKLLIRAVGPTLANYAVTGTLADPQITLYSGSTALATNDNWSSAANATDIAAAATSAGAFTLASGSKDAALLVTLGAGAYTASVSGVGGTTGTALVEIYVVR